MERGTTTTRLLAAGATAAAAAAVSCGVGIHTPEGWMFVSKEMDSRGGNVNLREATLELKPNCLEQPAAITLSRLGSIEHSGAVGPVFEIVLPDPYTLKGTAQLDITASPKVLSAPEPGFAVGYIEQTSNGKQWVPDSTKPRPSCPAGTVCGRVQVDNFASPGGIGGPTEIVRFAIVKRCNTTEACPHKQECSSGACQQCAMDTPCND